jgi:hypothetical protein
MTHRVPALVTAAVLAMGVTSLANVASAAPIANALAIKDSAPTNVEHVWWRGGWGWGLGAGLLGGAIIGGAIASAPYYGYPPPYYAGPGPYYYGPPVAYGPPPAGGDAVGYCMQRFRSYDPRTGTYLGTDGQRHPCP